ncbi:acyl-CoA dehydrogenase family protein [Streptomyces anulatus]|uniref:acyl-CoA dehydrogenase family protein n=1 Tax=Streptomyces anulatus TaxID=1892 RepID=UPI0036398D2B
MTFTHLPPEVAELCERTRRFVRDVIIDAEPAPGERLDQETRDRLQAAAKDAGVFAPHVPKEYGGQGIPIEHWSPILQEAGYSPIGPSARRCCRPSPSSRSAFSCARWAASSSGGSPTGGAGSSCWSPPC